MEKVEIIENNPTKSSNSLSYQIEIINPDLTIKTQDLAYSLKDRKQFKLHITELLQLRVIKESYLSLSLLLSPDPRSLVIMICLISLQANGKLKANAECKRS